MKQQREGSIYNHADLSHEVLQDAKQITERLLALRDDTQRAVLMRFFKTGPGAYGAGDEFLGIKVPVTRSVVKRVDRNLPLSETGKLLGSPWHEVRLCGLLILVEQFSRIVGLRSPEAMKQRDAIVSFYLRHADRINNWDLVDASAPKIIGCWLLCPTALGQQRDILDTLARSGHLWRQRISMVCTLTPTQQGDPSWCLRYAEFHLHATHDLMQKAVGWMLREMGKHVSMDLLRSFLDQHAHEMPRTMLRYAIEKFDEAERHDFMSRKGPRHKDG